jgi:hypothetical protein
MKKELLVSRIKTPDGTIVTSLYRHDYQTYKDTIDGYEYMLDGGNDYQRYSIPEGKNFSDVDFSIYSDSPYTEIREHYCRGGRGKNGDKPLKFVPLCEMSDEWLKNSIVYNIDRGYDVFCLANSLYMRELIYRQENEITIEDIE